MQHTPELSRLADVGEHQRLPEHDLLNSLIGRWITEGETHLERRLTSAENPGERYLRVGSGAIFVVHTAYGRIGEQSVGGIELIGYHEQAEVFRTHFFDSQGNVSTQELTFRDGVWIWSGAHARARGVLSTDGTSMPTRHEWSDDGKAWRPSMDVTLRKIH
jgi:Protein of unknown function (DUF1579)